ncbi:MAG: bacillithiol biosynthesis cysteine-adding enzyme BshC [Kofleriaceae bacterium]
MQGELPSLVARAARCVAPEVHRVLVAQNARLAPSAARDAHLASLASGAAVVVTGQQVGLFLGPLYTLYKAASAIVLARVLAAETGTPVVPVFWLQTEDHDLPEIATFGIADRTDVVHLTVPVDADNRISIAHLALPAETDGCLARLAEIVGSGVQAETHLARLRRHYRAGASWSAAFAGVIGELFAPEGLVVIDPRDPVLAAIAAPIHARALDDADRIGAALVARCAELERAGKTVQVHVRAGAPLSFFHPDGAQGPRVRLEPAPGGFAEVGNGRVHARAELAAAEPLQFSTSALLRPILQDTLLPTAAYVGGPAEVAYLAQITPLYRAFDLAPPLALQRARFQIVDDRIRGLLAKLGLVVADAARPEAELLARVRPAMTDVSATLLAPYQAAHAELAAALAPSKLVGIDRALARTQASVEHAIGKLAAKVERAACYEDAGRVEAVRRVRAVLAPDGAPQERVLGLAGFAARAGDRAIVERVLAAVDPFEPSLKELA